MTLGTTPNTIVFGSDDTGLGSSRPKLVFPVQNGINWDKPVFPVQNWEKLSKTGKNYAGLYFKLQKVSKNMHQMKI